MFIRDYVTYLRFGSNFTRSAVGDSLLELILQLYSNKWLTVGNHAAHN